VIDLASLEISKLKETIEESNFPFTVELIDWADLAESYKPNVEKEKVRL
jgi:hypothetical protein